MIFIIPTMLAYVIIHILVLFSLAFFLPARKMFKLFYV